MRWNGMRRKLSHVPPSLVAAVLLLLPMAIAALNLWMIVRARGRATRSIASVSALEHGRALARHLARQPVLEDGDISRADWGQFARLVESVRMLERGFVYATVRERDVVLFHAHGAPAADAAADAEAPGVRIRRENLRVGGEIVPVVTFTEVVRSGSGSEREVEVALRRDAMDQGPAAMAEAITSVMRVSLWIFAGTFAVSLALMILLIRRERRREARRRQEEHLAFAGAMAGGILHDFRNPLSAMNLDVQLLQKMLERRGECDLERAAGLARRIHQAMGRVDALFREFLVLARPGERVRETVDLAACVRDCLDLVRERMERAGLRIAMELGAGPLMVEGRAGELKRAVLNVLHNAEHYSPKGGSVTICAGIEDGWVRLEILDEGPGIPRGDRTRVFDFFFSRRAGGTGLGLALARSAVERCGGTIGAEAGPGGGARIVIRIPQAGAGM